MSVKGRQFSLAVFLLVCVATAFAQETPFGSRPNYLCFRQSSSAAKSDHRSYPLTQITLAMEVNEEACKDLVIAHEQVVRKLRDALNDFDSSGKPTARAHLAAKTLVALNDRTVIPFLAWNIDHSVPLPFSFTVEPVLEAHPYIVSLFQHEERGARAIIDIVAKNRKDTTTEQEWRFYGYVLLYIFGYDENGRAAATELIDEHDPQRDNKGLARLRETVRTVKRPVGR